MSGITLLIQTVPESLKDRLQAVAIRWKADRWEVGDITNELKEQVKRRLMDCSIMDIYGFMAQALNEEISARTVEYYAAIAAFYDQASRDEYDVLSFSHFARAMSYGDAWRSFLDLALDMLEEYGRMPSVASLEFCYHKRQEIKKEEPADMLFSNMMQPVATQTIPIMAAVASALEGLRSVLVGMGKQREAERLGEIIAEIASMC